MLKGSVKMSENNEKIINESVINWYKPAHGKLPTKVYK